LYGVISVVSGIVPAAVPSLTNSCQPAALPSSASK
jgi:hypothetical protein